MAQLPTSVVDPGNTERGKRESPGDYVGVRSYFWDICTLGVVVGTVRMAQLPTSVVDPGNKDRGLVAFHLGWSCFGTLTSLTINIEVGVLKGLDATV
ncbi:hypothetical protein NDU88_005605 [Pleurodeles waltl]|uniref:Uncharacterized protein n=1 Tax=Pleurodeles waltl TaxID=8319 RepID=A0AAV7MAZ3_PLEWA|nr:hypothetical protein NDU88_005605 [Pleurodeles waltl]